MKRKRKKELKKRNGRRTLKNTMIQDHEVRCNNFYIIVHVPCRDQMKQLNCEVIS